VADNPGQNRVDVTITSTNTGFTNLSVGRWTQQSFVTSFNVTNGGNGLTNIVLALAVLGWNDADDSISVGYYELNGSQGSHAFSLSIPATQPVTLGSNIGKTRSGGSTAQFQAPGGATPQVARSSGSDSFCGFCTFFRLS
jgi:hypothetical protein